MFDRVLSAPALSLILLIGKDMKMCHVDGVLQETNQTARNYHIC